MYLDHTPIESYTIASHEVFVKRDDLYASAPAPPIAKLRGVRSLLAELRTNKIALVGCFEASRSRIGHGLAAACADHGGISCIVAYPEIRNRVPSESVAAARRLGAELLPIPSNFVAICHRIAARTVQSKGGWMLPFGLECSTAINAIAAEAATVPSDVVRNGTVIVPCGSGVTLVGIVKGLKYQPRRILGVSVGRSTAAILGCLERQGLQVSDQLEIRPRAYAYTDAASTPTPFPCDDYYDRKAWKVLVSELHKLRPPVLFWNVGG